MSNLSWLQDMKKNNYQGEGMEYKVEEPQLQM